MKSCVEKVHLRQHYNHKHNSKNCQEYAHRCTTDVPMPHISQYIWSLCC